jgi:S-adenosylmethionine synthetase
MSRHNFLFTSESVTEGHHDKIADQISDGILDAIMAKDKRCRVACETILTTGIAFVAGEISTKAYVEIPDIIRETIREIGYTDATWGFDYHTCSVLTSIHQQSGDIAMGVDSGGAGDQGLMFGYASNETPELMPMPIVLAHRLTKRLADVRRKSILPWVRPDGKSQVTVEYRDGKPVRIDTIVVSSQHSPDVTSKKIERDIIEHVIKPVMPKSIFDPLSVKYHINPTGRFVTGGPMGDTGLTGRKIIVDTYGGVGSHGGGAFSGKDPSKVDRSASYMARYIAKNIVAAGLSDKCEVQLAYAIGIPEPVSILIDTKNTEKVSVDLLDKLVRRHFPMTPRGQQNLKDELRRLKEERPRISKEIEAFASGKDPDFQPPQRAVRSPGMAAEGRELLQHRAAGLPVVADRHACHRDLLPDAADAQAVQQAALAADR